MPRAKLEEYLLKPGTKHAREFFNVGYGVGDAVRLNQDIKRQFDERKAVNVVTCDDGAIEFCIHMSLGVTKKKLFKTVWRVDTLSSKPRFITAYREGRRHV